MAEPQRFRRRLFLRSSIWARRVGLGRKLAYALTAAAIASGIATYAAITESGPLGGSDPTTVIILLNLDLVLMLLLGAFVARRIVGVWTERRSGAAGARLHVRLVVLFSVVAVTPTIMMAIFSVLFFNVGVQAWFSERVRTALQESQAVAKAYLEEHQQIIGGDALAMANDINRAGLRSPARLNQLVATQAAIRALPEAVVFDEAGRILARSGFAFSMELSVEQIPIWAFEKARGGEVAVLTTENDDRVRALVKLEDITGEDAYLFVGRFVDPKVIGHMERTSEASAEYKRLEGQRSGLEITFSLIFAVVALMLLLAAVWVGLTLATQLARPIIGLIDAAERVRAGDLSARVNEHAADEIGSLARAFNRMTNQLGEQRQELMDANRLLDERRRFTETVLAGVSAGVIGLDRDGHIELTNRSASDLLGVDLDGLIGAPLGEVMPEVAEQIEAVRRRPERVLQREITLVRDGRTRILLARLTAEQMEAEILGFVVTFDDITELLSAQRKAAWADVARRIAHEIKNPLTPIQLSAERLKRKYLKEITSDPDTFVTCTDTIVRQVGDIGRMVDEFSSFARMPAPVMKAEDLRGIVRQTVFLTRNGYPAVTFETALPDDPVMVACDSRQIGQAVTNLLKNAVEAIEGREGEALPPGRVALALYEKGDATVIEIADNGKGLPKEQRDRLTEPYVTTRAKGTGLGLAIVKKIMEDHGGDLQLEDLPTGGACVRLVFQRADASLSTAPAEATATHGA